MFSLSLHLLLFGAFKSPCSRLDSEIRNSRDRFNFGLIADRYCPGRDDSNSLPKEHSDVLRFNASILELRECPSLPRVPAMMCAIEFGGQTARTGSMSVDGDSIGGCHRSSLAHAGMTIEDIRGHYRSSALIAGPSTPRSLELQRYT